MQFQISSRRPVSQSEFESEPEVRLASRKLKLGKAFWTLEFVSLVLKQTKWIIRRGQASRYSWYR
jgi:hypothetical protein